MPHAGICAGGGWQQPSLPRHESVSTLCQWPWNRAYRPKSWLGFDDDFDQRDIAGPIGLA